YVGADGAALTPSLQRPSEAHLWGQRAGDGLSLASLVAPDAGAPTRARATPKAVEALGRTVYDVPHEPRPWGRRVGAYLWTKSIAAGAALIAGLGTLAGWPPASGLALPAVALVLLLATTILLVTDLKRPDRFHYIILKPNPRSWLVWGAWILMAFGLVAGLWFLASLAGRSAVLLVLAVPLIALALAAAGYSAFLFAQAEGRDFWQSPLVLPHLLVAAVIAGAAAALLTHAPSAALRGLCLTGLGANLLLILAELFTPHANVDAAAAARLITHGSRRHRFWGEVVVLGHLIPALLLLPALPLTARIASLLVLAGLYRWEACWVEAGQAVPLS
ncbi:MAG: polysulfide reductase NrfD, partial [Candidatus Rokubacteria bacterium]|nr:polysulfide reductase NrfD [Candidatus Rokubacteria bacterium]